MVVEATTGLSLAALHQPGAAAALGRGSRVAVLLCGGNVDLDNLPWVNACRKCSEAVPPEEPLFDL